jgi:precorrin-4/cobalt-precorrin-4 C11-methyltransferase
MTVYFIGAGPGAPDLITVRGLELLRRCPVCVYAGSLVSPEHLAALPEGAAVHNSVKMSLEQIGAVFLEAHAQGRDVARLHTGDPTLYGAIGEQISFCGEHGIACEVVPGVSSFTASAAALNSELTVPNIAQTVILTRCEGRTPMPERERLERLARARTSMCVFLSAGLIDGVVDALRPHYPGDTPVAVVCRATWPDQRIITANLQGIAARVKAAGITKTAMILVGQFLAQPHTRSRLYDPDFTHEYRDSGGEQR